MRLDSRLTQFEFSAGLQVFVFARGGSERVPDKNLRRLGKLTLLEYSIFMGIRFVGRDRVWVSTDSDRIALVGERAGVNVILRGAELSGSNSSEWLAWRHAVNHVLELGRNFTTFLSLPPTAPFREEEDILGCLSLLDDSVDCVVTATPAKNNPHFNMVVSDGDGLVRPVIRGSSAVTMQQAPSVYDMTTVAYATRPDYIMSSGSLWDGRVKAYVVPVERSLDIDTEWDFRLANLIFDDRQGR